MSNDLPWGEQTDYIIKKANRRLYALRILKRSGFSKPACSSGLENATPAFANLPQYLSYALEKVQKRALATVFPDLLYTEALSPAKVATLAARRDEAFRNTINSLNSAYPLYNLVNSRLVNSVKPYNLRYASSIVTKTANTDRFRNFVTNKFAVNLS